MFKNIPNFLSLLNLFFGILSIKYVFEYNFKLVLIFSSISLFCDYFDGFIARKYKLVTNFGKYLDSSADMVSFGILPGFILMKLIDNSNLYLLSNLAFLIPLFTAIRLAKFNNSSKINFIGLPSPINSYQFVYIAILTQYPELTKLNFMMETEILFLLILLSSYLLVSNINFFSMKNINIHKKFIIYLFFLLVILLIIFFKLDSILLLIYLYIFLNIFLNILKLKLF